VYFISAPFGNYINTGADHISLGTVCFTPWKLKGIIDGQ